MFTERQIIEIKDILENEYCSTEEAARLLKVTRGRVNQFCIEQRIKGAFKIRDIWFIPKASVDNFQRKPRGFPKGTHKYGSKFKREVSQWLEVAGYPPKKEE